MKYNRNFGTLTEQTITYAPRDVEIDRRWYCPASEEQLRSLGYKSIIDTPYPTDGKSYSSKWVEQENSIVKVWELIPQPVPEPLTPAEKREEAYRTRLVIIYPKDSNELITVDQARAICDDYCYETTDRAKEIVEYLSDEITTAKEAIRAEFPDKKKKGK